MIVDQNYYYLMSIIHLACISIYHYTASLFQILFYLSTPQYSFLNSMWYEEHLMLHLHDCYFRASSVCDGYWMYHYGADY